MSRSIFVTEIHRSGKKGVVVTGGEQCADITFFLAIERSAWFEVTPLPEDQYEIVYKDEHHLAVLNYCTREATAEEILRDFVDDIEASGIKIEEIGKDWPDLIVTYHKAKAYLGSPTF